MTKDPTINLLHILGHLGQAKLLHQPALMRHHIDEALMLTRRVLHDAREDVREREAQDALLDGIESGDLDRNGEAMSWPKYRSA